MLLGLLVVGAYSSPTVRTVCYKNLYSFLSGQAPNQMGIPDSPPARRACRFLTAMLKVLHPVIQGDRTDRQAGCRVAVYAFSNLIRQ